MFVAEIRCKFQPCEIEDFFQSFNSGRVADNGDDYEFEGEDAELLISEAEQIVLMEKATSLLLGTSA